MALNPQVLFLSLIRACKCDLIMDIGSCDGSQSLGFREILPNAKIIAIEANPYNYKDMVNNSWLEKKRITIHNLAMSNKDGKSEFYITPADYNTPFSPAENNRGTSSLLAHPDLPEQLKVEIATTRLDSFLQKEHLLLQKIGLWIDVEGAEYSVFEGMENAKEKIKIIHVETSLKPLRKEQICFKDVKELLNKYGFRFIGTNIKPSTAWGDAVFASKDVPWTTIFLAQTKAFLGGIITIDKLAAFLKQKHPQLYKMARKAFFRGI